MNPIMFELASVHVKHYQDAVRRKNGKKLKDVLLTSRNLQLATNQLTHNN